MFGYNPQINVDRINQQIQELQRMKDGYQTMQQPQPIQNIINTTPQNIQFEARFLNENEKVEDLLVQHKTAFICPENGYLKIKEINGDITEYELIKPKDEKDLKIEELERKLREYEHEHINNDKSNEKGKSTSNDTKYDKK